MKNTLIAIAGLLIIVALGYTMFQNTTPSTELLNNTVTNNSTGSTNASAPSHVAYEPGAFQDFSQSAYDSALADGKTVILDFHANWCPTCRANEPIITNAFESNTNTNLVGFKVDYDKEVALKRTYNITSQSTIIKTSASRETEQLGPGPITAEGFSAFLQT